MCTAASGEESMASKCLAFCQTLVSQGQVFNFSLSIGSDFTFSLDTRSKAFESQVNKKKLSPSTVRRNEERNTWLRSSKSLHLGYPMMERLCKLQLCFHVTNVITWVPLKRG